MLYSATNNNIHALFTKHTNPIITPSNYWEQSGITQPTVLFKDGKYYLWYVGINSNRYQIGYAHSLDGINWEKNSEPVLSRLNIDNLDTHDPSVMFDNVSNQFVMWYASSNLSNNQKYQIYRATSSDGINWSLNPQTPVYKGILLWDQGGVTGPNVIKLSNNDYRMWYMATGTGKWRIGYATSADGINWIPYLNNPIMPKTYPWESEDFGHPDVTWNGLNFEMFYSTSDIIAYLYSSNGIDWLSNQIYNPVINRGPIGTSDSLSIGDPSSIRKNNNISIYYRGLGNYNGKTTLSIHLAEGNLFPTTPTPIPTVIPTPTAVPTVTPTPTIQHTKKVVFIPGLGGSWNVKDIVECNLNTDNNNWTLNPAAQEIYSPAIQALEQNGYEPLVYTYDWRKDVRDHIEDLSQTINAEVSPYQSLSVVGHSLGGLIGRSYIEEKQYLSRVSRYLSVGTPHKGAIQTYPVWVSGRINEGQWYWKLASTLAMTACKAAHGGNPKTITQEYFPSIQNILPTFDFLRNKKTGVLTPVSEMQYQNNYLPTSFQSPFFGIKVGTIVGSGYQTGKEYLTQFPSGNGIPEHIWLDGITTKTITTEEGDGTVLKDSALLPNAENNILTSNHSQIIQGQQGISLMLNFLGTSQPQQVNAFASQDEPHSAAMIVVYPGRAEVKDNTSIQSDSNGLLIFKNPNKEKKTLTFVPESEITNVFIGQLTRKNEVNWTQYKFTNKKPFTKTIQLDPDTTINQVLSEE